MFPNHLSGSCDLVNLKSFEGFSVFSYCTYIIVIRQHNQGFIHPSKHDSLEGLELICYSFLISKCTNQLYQCTKCMSWHSTVLLEQKKCLTWVKLICGTLSFYFKSRHNPFSYITVVPSCKIFSLDLDILFNVNHQSPLWLSSLADVFALVLFLNVPKSFLLSFFWFNLEWPCYFVYISIIF